VGARVAGASAGARVAGAQRGGAQHGGAAAWIEAALVTALALGVRLAGLDHTPHTDELPPVLAARSLLASGATAAGSEVNSYAGAQLFTKLVAALFRLGGESLAVARIPAVAGGTLLVLAVYLWVRAERGRVAGWVAAILLALNPLLLSWSQAVHVAVWQALATWLGAVAAYRLGSAVVRSRGSGSGASGGRTARTARTARAGAALAALVAIAVTGSLSLALAWPILHAARPEMRAFRTDLGFYDRLLAADYAALWPLLPLAWLLAFAAAPRALGFLGVLFAAWLAGLSLAPGKEERYLLHVLPVFAAVAGSAAQVLFERARAACGTFLAAGRAGPPWWARALAAAVLAAALWPLVAANGAFALSWRMLTVSDADWSDRRPYRGQADWRGAAAELAAVADSVDVLVSSNALQSLYSFGRVDFELSVRALRQGGGSVPEFSRSRIAGRPMISAPESVARLMEMHKRGLIVIEKADWHAGWGVPGGTANLITAYADPVPLSSEHRILAYRWRPLAE